MKIIEPGHIYDLEWLDGQPEDVQYADQRVSWLIFVNREADDAKFNAHGGTQTQEVLRALIDRTQHCDRCLRWPGNDQIIHHLRMALALHEARALERKTEKGLIKPEQVETGHDGHFALTRRPSAEPAERGPGWA